MTRSGLVCLLLASVAWGQADGAKAGGAAQGQKSQGPASVSQPATAPANGTEKKEIYASNVPPDAPIITIAGLCDHPPAGKAATTDCKTVITRAQFDEVLNLTIPDALPAARRIVANTYIQMLVKAQKAREAGLTQQRDFDSRVEVLRLLFYQKALDKAINEQEWNGVTDKEIDDYYAKNPLNFVQVDVDRLFVPKFHPDYDPSKNLTDAEKHKIDEQWYQTLKEYTEKLRARWLAGEDLLALEKDAYKFTEVTNNELGPNDITLKKVRREMFTPGQRAVMEVKVGDLSPVLSDDNGYFVFRVTKREVLPLEKMRGEIHTTLRDERVQKDKDAIEKAVAAATVYNDLYFGPETQEDGTSSTGAAPVSN